MRTISINTDKAKREKALNIITSSEYAGESVDRKCERIPCERHTYYRWMKDEQFLKEIEERLSVIRTDSYKQSRVNTPKILKKLDERAEGGDTSAIKLHLQVHGDLKEQIQHSGEIKSPAEEVQEEEHVKEMMGFLGSKKLTDSEQETAQ